MQRLKQIINMNIVYCSAIIEEEEDADSDIVMQLPVTDTVVSLPSLSSPPGGAPPRPAAFPGAALMMPTILTIKQETTHFTVPIAESEHYRYDCASANITCHPIQKQVQ